MSISNCTFSMQQLHEKAHHLTINFVDKDQNNQGSVSMLFKKTSDDPCQKALHDICSQNGKCSDMILTSLFKPKDVEDSEKILFEKNNHHEEAHTLFVLDIKGNKKGYLDPKISTCEAAVLDFFKNPCAKTGNAQADEIHKLFQSVKIDYIFNEGSLKSKILQTEKFTPAQIKYLQKGQGGSLAFCKIAEYILTGFKNGFEASYKAVDYIVPVFQESSFKPHKTNITFYPPSYATLYHHQSSFCESLSSCYKISGKSSQNKVSIIKVENLHE